MSVKSRIRIEVTEEGIERAHRNDSYSCVVAQAIAQAIPDATRIEVDVQTIRFTVGNERLVFLTPYVVQGYIVAFDAGDPVVPFSFQLRDPKRIKRQVRTESGRAADRAATRARRRVARKRARVGTPAEGSDSPEAERAAAKAAYAEASAAHPNMKTKTTDGGGPKAPPRVFKRKKRAYGHRLLRINQ